VAFKKWYFITLSSPKNEGRRIAEFPHDKAIVPFIFPPKFIQPLAHHAGIFLFLLLRSRYVNSHTNKMKLSLIFLSCRKYWLRLRVHIIFFTFSTFAFPFLAKTITIVSECVNTIGYSMCKTRMLQHLQSESTACFTCRNKCMSKVLFGVQLHHFAFRWRFFFPSLSIITNDTLYEYTKVSNV